MLALEDGGNADICSDIAINTLCRWHIRRVRVGPAITPCNELITDIGGSNHLSGVKAITYQLLALTADTAAAVLFCDVLDAEFLQSKPHFYLADAAYRAGTDNRCSGVDRAVQSATTTTHTFHHIVGIRQQIELCLPAHGNIHISGAGRSTQCSLTQLHAVHRRTLGCHTSERRIHPGRHSVQPGRQSGTTIDGGARCSKIKEIHRHRPGKRVIGDKRIFIEIEQIRHLLSRLLFGQLRVFISKPGNQTAIGRDMTTQCLATFSDSTVGTQLRRIRHAIQRATLGDQ